MTWGWVIGWAWMGYGGLWAVLLFGWLLGMVYARYFVVLLVSMQLHLYMFTSLYAHSENYIYTITGYFTTKGKTLMLNPPLISPPHHITTTPPPHPTPLHPPPQNPYPPPLHQPFSAPPSTHSSPQPNPSHSAP